MHNFVKKKDSTKHLWCHFKAKDEAYRTMYNAHILKFPTCYSFLSDGSQISKKLFSKCGHKIMHNFVKKKDSTKHLWRHFKAKDAAYRTMYNAHILKFPTCYSFLSDGSQISKNCSQSVDTKSCITLSKRKTAPNICGVILKPKMQRIEQCITLIF